MSSEGATIDMMRGELSIRFNDARDVLMSVLAQVSSHIKVLEELQATTGSLSTFSTESQHRQESRETSGSNTAALAPPSKRHVASATAPSSLGPQLEEETDLPGICGDQTNKEAARKNAPVSEEKTKQNTDGRSVSFCDEVQAKKANNPLCATHTKEGKFKMANVQNEGSSLHMSDFPRQLPLPPPPPPPRLACGPYHTPPSEIATQFSIASESCASASMYISDGLAATSLSYFDSMRLQSPVRVVRSAGIVAEVSLDTQVELKGRHRGVFVDAGKVKEDVKRSLMKPTYKVTEFYKKTGCPQSICRSSRFDNCVLFVIFLNGLWLGIDTEYNDAVVTFDAHPVFVIVDQFFCLFFFVELLLRFLSFEHKHYSCRDFWFVFDSFLVLLMALESWVLNGMILIFGSHDTTSQDVLQNTSLLRMLRLMRLFRLARLAKLMRKMPEIMIIINGLAASVRSVICTFILLFCLVYIFAVAFASMAKGSQLGDKYFSSVSHSLVTLLVYGGFPDLDDPFQAAAEEGVLFFLCFLVFAVLASVSIMNMMIGVLVDVVKSTSEVERESMDVEFVRDNLLQVIDEQGLGDISDPTRIKLSKENVWNIISSPMAAQSLATIGVDVIAYLELLEYVFTSRSTLTFPSFVDSALQFRSTNTALVRDIVDLRRYLKHELQMLVGSLNEQRHEASIGNSLPLRTLASCDPRRE